MDHHHLHGAALTSTWAALIAGVIAIAVGLWAVLARPAALDDRWPSGPWFPVLIGLFVLIETVPRVAGASDSLLGTLSWVAFLPLLGMVLLASRGRRTKV